MNNSQPDHLIERAARQSRNPLLGPAVPPSASAAPRPPAAPPAPAAAPAPALAPRGGAASSPAIRPVEIETMRKAGLAVFSSARTRVMEEWRVVASTLLRRQPVRQPAGLGNVLMITSSRAKEGKSFCSLNLAATVANNRGAPTVLVDLDAKPDALSHLFGLGDRPGLLHLMADPSLPLGDVLVPTAFAKLHILPLGRNETFPANGIEAGVSFAMIATLERVARQLGERLLVVDTAPCLATGDAAALAPLVGQIAMVVAAEATQRNDIDASLALLTPCSTVSLVLNKVRTHTAGHFGVETYGYYGQGRPGQGRSRQVGTNQSDAGQSDAGQSDAGQSDSGQSDSGQSDSGQSDAGQSDGGQRR